MADIALACVPLCMKLFSECLNGYRLFTEAKELGRDSQRLLWKFRIEEARLRIWGRDWGLFDEDSATASAEARDRDDLRIIPETLFRISNLFKDYKQLENRYGL